MLRFEHEALPHYPAKELSDRSLETFGSKYLNFLRYKILYPESLRSRYADYLANAAALRPASRPKVIARDRELPLAG